ncbi:hypothetical protein P3S67_022217 [Capsicum chacoense]
MDRRLPINGRSDHRTTRRRNPDISTLISRVGRAEPLPFAKAGASHSDKGTVSTLNLESVNNDHELKVVDLNKVMFNSK